MRSEATPTPSRQPDEMILPAPFAQHDELPIDTIAQRQATGDIGALDIVDVDAAAFNRAPRIAARSGDAAADERIDQRHPFSGEVVAWQRRRWHIIEDVGDIAGAKAGQGAAEQGLRRLFGAGQRSFAVHHAGHFAGQALLRGAAFGMLGRDLLKIGNFVGAQPGEVLQVLADIGIIDVVPELVEAVGRGALRVEPDRARLGLAELGAVGFGHQRIDQPIGALPERAADQLDTGGDIAPLVAAASLKFAAVMLEEIGKIVSLQEHVAEFGE